MENAHQNPRISTLLPRFLIALTAIALACAAYAVFLYANNFTGTLSSESESWGQFGDFFGGTLNPLFAFFALIALLLSIHVQSIELRQSSLELSRAAAALKEQQNSMAQQNFENMFFQLVKLHNDIVSAIDLRSISRLTKNPRITVGRDCFKVFYRRLSKEMDKHLRGDYFDENEHQGSSVAYRKFHSKNEQNIGHYFRNLYRSFKFISESNANDKRRYSGILRAQLSTYELLLLFYNGKSAVGSKFQAYIEEFSLLENIPIELLFSQEDLRLYDIKAFGDQAEKVKSALNNNS
jgi:uncharacterized membrane protein